MPVPCIFSKTGLCYARFPFFSRGFLKRLFFFWAFDPPCWHTDPPPVLINELDVPAAAQNLGQLGKKRCVSPLGVWNRYWQQDYRVWKRLTAVTYINVLMYTDQTVNHITEGVVKRSAFRNITRLCKSFKIKLYVFYIP